MGSNLGFHSRNFRHMVRQSARSQDTSQNTCNMEEGAYSLFGEYIIKLLSEVLQLDMKVIASMT